MSKKNDEAAFLASGKLSLLLSQFAIPCIVSLLISSLYNIVDQIFIGNHPDLGYLGNAATTIVFPLTVIAMAFAWCFGDGCAAWLSIAQGRGDTQKIHQAVGNSLLWTLVWGVIFWVAGFSVMQPLLRLFGASDASLPFAKDYFTIILAAMPIFMLANTLSPIIRADGAPRFSMLSTLSGAIINIILDPIFIFPLGWGIKGAAYATIIGQIVSAIIAVVYLWRSQSFRLSGSSFKLDAPLMKNVIKLGVSTFITQMSIVAISLACNMMLLRAGQASEYGADIPMAAFGIVMKVFSIVISFTIGIALGAQPIFGYNYGAQNFQRVRALYWLVVKCTLVIGVISTLMFELCPQLVIGIFGMQNELYERFAILTFRIFLSFILGTCFTKVTSIFFQAVGQPVKATIISLVRDIVCFIPLVIILPQFMGIEGVLWAAPLADVIGTVLAIIVTLDFFKKLNCHDNVTTIRQKIAL